MYTPWSSPAPTPPPFPGMRDLYSTLPRHPHAHPHTHTHTHTTPIPAPPDPRSTHHHRRRRPTTHLHVHHAPLDTTSDAADATHLGLGDLGLNMAPPLPPRDLSPPSDASFFDDEDGWDAGFAVPAVGSPRELQRVGVRVSAQTAARLGGGDVLVLPRDMVRMRIEVRGRRGSDVVRALVPGDMRVREVVRQVGGEGRLLVKWRGRWQDAGAGTRVGDVVGRGFEGEDGVVEVCVGGSGYGREREEPRDGPRWERSRNVERMRVY